jgi:UPF0755 protein
MKRARILIAVGLVLIALLGASAVLLGQTIRQIETVRLSPDGRTTIEVPSGIGFAALAQDLAERGLIDHPLPVRVYARWHGDARRIQAGEYAIDPDTTAASLIDRMVAGEVIQYQFTIIEGWRFSELRAAVREHPAIERTLPADLSAPALMERIGRPGQRAEGRFLPETYRFPRGETDEALLTRANRDLEAVLESAWADRQPDLPLDSPYELLILASIIEKETGRASERRRIAGVFTRRLERGMRLQTDPTVIYGLGERFDGDLLRRHLREDTAYNTYTRHGLPPTPIALPGRAAIEAAADPAAGDSLYFVSRGDGSHVFSETLEAHNRAVRRYQLGETD